jgi:hypothetical protein
MNQTGGGNTVDLLKHKIINLDKKLNKLNKLLS